MNLHQYQEQPLIKTEVGMSTPDHPVVTPMVVDHRGKRGGDLW